MIKDIIFWGTVFFITFSVMVVITEGLLLLFRNSLTYHIQHGIRKSIPFLSLTTTIFALLLRTTTDFVYTLDTPFINTALSDGVKARIDNTGFVMNAFFLITAVLMLQFFVKYSLCILSIKKSTNATDRFKNELGKRRIRVYLWEKTKTPFCFGVIKKTIVIPSDYEFGLSYAIRHEISHCDNNDPLTIIVAKVIMILMWFNPLAYLYYQRIRIGCEYACDERVTKNFSFTEKKKYVEVILASTHRKPPEYVGAALSTEKTLKNRFKNILSNKKRVNKKALVAVIMTVSIITIMIPIIAALKTPKQRTKIVKINYSSEQEMKKSVYYEECFDGFWFRGDLYFDSVEDLDYGVKSARYTGILYEGE